MINIEWNEKDGQRKYDNLLSPVFVGEYVQDLINRGCDYIMVIHTENKTDI